MTRITDPAAYEAWYHTPRGSWVSNLEFSLLMKLLPPMPEGTLLDVGCGTGHFSRRFAHTGLVVTGIDPDHGVLRYAHARGERVCYAGARATALPFADSSFEVCSAITSLCFVDEPVRALEEMWRVSRRGVVLGLLNRHSLLYLRKHGRGGYAGARWDTLSEVRAWWSDYVPPPGVRVCSAVWVPGGGWLARALESRMSRMPCWGGFLGIALIKKNN